MHKKIITAAVLVVAGWAGMSSAWACSLLPQPAATLCNMACNNLSGTAQWVCKLGQGHHNN